jgi:acetyltransferase
MDFLQEWSEDSESKVISGYIEGVKHGLGFVKAASEVTKKKPVVLLKAGTTEAGVRAASSHTGTLAGAEKVGGFISSKWFDQAK